MQKVGLAYYKSDLNLFIMFGVSIYKEAMGCYKILQKIVLVNNL